MENTSVSVANRTLSARYFPVAETKPKLAVLHIHGWQSGQNRNFELAEALQQLFIPSFTFDLSGHKESEGDLASLSRKDFFDDVLAGYDALRKKVGADTPILVHGSSFGAYLAALLPKHRTLRGLILRVPADFPKVGFDAPFTARDTSNELAWFANTRGVESSDALEGVSTFDGPIFLVEVSKDELVPHQCVQNYADSARKKEMLAYITMMGAPHSFTHAPKHKRDFIALTVGWIQAL